MVSIQLTEMGEKFADETILHVFQYILLLKVRKFLKGVFKKESQISAPSSKINKIKAPNMSYLTDSCIGFTLKMESVSKNTMVKSGLEKFILKSLHAGT